MSNSNLQSARAAKNDEFYTRLEDVEAELLHYKNHFKGKIVYCPCDDPTWSSFYLFFKREFEALGLSSLIATHYIPEGTSYRREYNGTDEIDTPLEGDGDFRSEECKAILDEVDIVATNPPFSLFRDFIDLLEQKQKLFLVVGSMNAITYKNIFALIQGDKLWLGVNKVKAFTQPNGTTKKFGNICWFTNITHNKRNTPLVLTEKYYEQS